jgi:hypothetical protein
MRAKALKTEAYGDPEEDADLNRSATAKPTASPGLKKQKPAVLV